MKALQEILHDRQKPSNSTKQPENRLRNLDSDKAAQITKLVQQCWNSLNLYGKDASQFKETNQLFLVALAGYPIHRIREAFFTYIETGEAMPTPAAIRKILDKQQINSPEDYSQEFIERMEENRALYIADQREYSRRQEGWASMTDQEKAEFESIMAKYKASVQREKPPEKEVRSHNHMFDRSVFLELLKAAHRKMKGIA